jgi:hypothetical protein
LVLWLATYMAWLALCDGAWDDETHGFVNWGWFE